MGVVGGPSNLGILVVSSSVNTENAVGQHAIKDGFTHHDLPLAVYLSQKPGPAEPLLG